MDYLLYLSYIGALYGLFKVLYDMYKSKKWIEIRKSPEFVIMIISVAIVTCFFIPWSKFHFGDVKPRIVYVQLPVNKTDSLGKLPVKTLKEPPHVANPIFKSISVGNVATDTKKDEYIPKSSSKYDLSNAQLSQSAVGDHAKVEIYNDGKVLHPSDDFIKAIIDSTRNTKSQIYIEYHTAQAKKNRAYSIEIMKKLIGKGFTNVSIMDSTNTNLSSNPPIWKSDGTVIVFVSKY
ncbi:hypothetical protein GWR56_18755 [Mucilaginibacter sp. 14171R-50]|uniref:hypothetical protein n=1 Tax=Mucilaginibacter sp. 14171R-50 TaxID=2703789 RepID=UPI00138B3EF0|nr:hypothetical protein [Mucilaginibacter sp. 14171R-50]QHS57486.1 hypothetical protein GWR56_18755 [Mucilaginibacter sp. 14171R-50]